MKSIKEAKYIVEIWSCSNGYFWNAYTCENLGYRANHSMSAPKRGFHYKPFTQKYIKPGRGYKRRINAIRSWKRFAATNDIINYKLDSDA